jgi:hypothetical protein
VCPDAQHIAGVTSRGGTKRSPPVQGDGVPASPQQPLCAANEHANAGNAAPRRLTQMITKAVRRRSTGNHSKFHVGWTPQEDIRSAMPPDKSTVQGVPCRGSRAFEVLNADLELPWECIGIVV